MKTFLIRHFPKSKISWKKYSSIFFPIMLATTLVAINGMIDNFMVGHINQGVTALSAINSWTNILTGLFLATSAAGSVIMSQFYHAKDYKIVKQLVRLRYLINIFGAIILIILSIVIPEIMIKVFLKGDPSDHSYLQAMDRAKDYLQICIIQWALMAFTFEMASQLREIGHGKITLLTSLSMLIFNITFNSVFMYALDMGVQGAALASGLSRLFNFVILPIYMYKKLLPTLINPFSIFKISKQLIILFVKRWVYFTSIFTVVFFITFRNFFYDGGYPVNKYLGIGKGVGGMAILGLTGAFMNIFTTTFSALPNMAANFVGSELGKNNLKQAKINSDELKGFNTLMALFLACLLMITSFIIPYMSFISHNQYDDKGNLIFDSHKHLEQVKYSTLVIAFYYPFWIWFSTSYRNGQTGGKGSFFALWDWIISGPLQLGWAALVMYVMVPNDNFLQNNFWASYMIFFTSDLIKLLGQEIYYYKYKWLHWLTKEQSEQQKDASQDFGEKFVVMDSSEI